mgnify:CR=1 FL=1
MEPKEALLNLMCLPTSRFDGVCRTSDGFYVAQTKGDIGYNHFLGKPSLPHPGPGRDKMLTTWAKLSKEERQAVLSLAAHPIDGLPIRLAQDFGVPIDEKS